MDPIFPNEESQQVIHGTPGCAQVKSVSSQKCQPQVDPELTVKVNLTINLLCQLLSQIARGGGGTCLLFKVFASLIPGLWIVGGIMIKGTCGWSREEARTLNINLSFSFMPAGLV